MRPARFTKEDWLAFGLQQLASAGPNALKINMLCSAAQKTIGSFYHHFKDQSDYFDALLAYWKQKNTVDLIEQLSARPDSDAKAQELDVLAMAMDQTEDVGIRVLGHQNPSVAAMVAEVDAIRIAFMQRLYAERFTLSEEEAKALAQLEYAAFVGAQSLWHLGEAETMLSLSALFQRLVEGTFAAPNTRSSEAVTQA